MKREKNKVPSDAKFPGTDKSAWRDIIVGGLGLAGFNIAIVVIILYVL